jgi:CHAT domain-containing protein
MRLLIAFSLSGMVPGTETGAFCQRSNPCSNETATQIKYHWERLINVFDKDPDSCIWYGKQVDSMARLCPERFADYIILANDRIGDQAKTLDEWGYYLSRTELAIQEYKAWLTPDSIISVYFLPKFNRCRWYDSGGDYDRALACYKDFFEEYPDSLPDDQNFRFTVPVSIGWVMTAKGDFKTAIEWLDVSKRHLPANNAYYAGFLYNFYGKAWYRLGYFPNAEKAFRKSVETWLSSPNREKYDDCAAEAYSDWVRLYASKGNFDSCIILLKEALSLRLKSHWSRAFIHAQFSQAYLEKEYYDSALVHIDKALENAHLLKPDKFYLTGEYLSLKGEIYLRMGLPDKALNYLQPALFHLSEEFDSHSLAANPEPQKSVSKVELLAALHRKAKALYQRFLTSPTQPELLQWALDASMTAVSLLLILRISYPDDEAKELLSNDRFDVFEQAMEAAFALHNLDTTEKSALEQAFSICEASKAHSLLENLKNIEGKSFAGVPPALISQEFSFKLRIVRFEKKWLESIKAGDTANEMYFRDSLIAEKRAFEDWVKALETNYPAYYQLKYNLKTATIAEVQHQIADGETLIEYFYGEKQVYIFVINAGNTVFHAFPLTPDFTQNLDHFVQAVSNRKGLSTASKMVAFRGSGFQLYRQLLGSFDLTDSLLVIIPDGPLNYLPFAAMPTDTLPQADPRNLPFLIRQKTIRQAYSASVLMQQQLKTKKEPSISPMPLLVIAPSRFPDGSRLLLNERDLGKLFDGNVHILRAPRKEAVKTALSAGYESIFVFTHASSKGPDPYLKLLEDSLTMKELYATPIKARLVLLGACETGLGLNKRGEGVMSLARGFAYQNVPNTIMTLWQVRQSSALKISLDFLRFHLLGNQPPAVALRRAQLLYLENPHELDFFPFFWAGFVTIGG